MTYIQKSRSMAGVTPDPEVWFFLLFLDNLCSVFLENSAAFP
jgi:hypothetical protein